MSLAPLMGLPGKVKTLLDRLTATRAGNLDNLNTTVSSRAAAATALSTANWTNTRAGNLDTIPTLAGRLTAGRATLLDNLSNLDAAVSGSKSLSKHAEFYISGNGGSSRYNVSLGSAFDVGRSIVQISTPLSSSTSNPESVHVAWGWTNDSQLTINFYELGTNTIASIGTNVEFYVTVKEFTQ